MGLRVSRATAGCPRTGLDDRGRLGFLEEPVVATRLVLVGLERRVEPGGAVALARVLEAALDPPERLRHVRQDLELAIDEQSQRGRLNAPRRPRRLLLAAGEPLGERPRRIQTDQPVGIGAALRRCGEPVELFARQERLEASADRVRRHRLQPKPPDGLVRAEVADDLAKDQLAFATRIARVHEAVDVLSLRQLLDRADALGVSLLGLDLKARFTRQDRQDLERPSLVLLVEFLGREKFEQVAHREGDDVIVILLVPIVLREAAEHPDDVLGDARLLGNDEGLPHALPH